ncbi:S24 family peptidase [Pantoea sp. LMR881]|uniref:S24 family peptidase n=1 Tax=Pantoea sp. LMR881 TaxID=3014336 RepID=UPI0022AF766A|nr:S24 family peptidase [Pantoea sp. LMR881]MCZ4058067.1 S24 family peptidase [Pantoea sp. LMR881]
MEPDFKEGDVIIVDPEIEPVPGEFVVAKNGEHEATFKKYRPTFVTQRGLSILN